MFTILHNWLEKISFRSDVGLARKQMRDARRVLRNQEQAHKVLEDIEKLLKKDEVLHEDIDKTTKKLAKSLEKELLEIMNIVAEHRIIDARNLKKLQELYAAISSRRGHTEVGSSSKELLDKMQKEIYELQNLIQKEIDSFIATFSSYQNSNLNLLQALGDESQSREAQYAARKTRTDIKKYDADMKLFIKKLRSTAALDEKDEARLKDAIAQLQEEFKDQQRLLQTTIQLFYKFQKTITNVEKVFSQDDYPKVWKIEELKNISAFNTKLVDWIKQEIAEERMELSHVERAIPPKLAA